MISGSLQLSGLLRIDARPEKLVLLAREGDDLFVLLPYGRHHGHRRAVLDGLLQPLLPDGFCLVSTIPF